MPQSGRRPQHHFRQIGTAPTLTHVRFAPKADMRTLASICPLCANSVINAVQQTVLYFDQLVSTRHSPNGEVSATPWL